MVSTCEAISVKNAARWSGPSPTNSAEPEFGSWPSLPSPADPGLGQGPPLPTPSDPGSVSSSSPPNSLRSMVWVQFLPSQLPDPGLRMAGGSGSPPHSKEPRARGWRWIWSGPDRGPTSLLRGASGIGGPVFVPVDPGLIVRGVLPPVPSIYIPRQNSILVESNPIRALFSALVRNANCFCAKIVLGCV